MMVKIVVVVVFKFMMGVISISIVDNMIVVVGILFFEIWLKIWCMWFVIGILVVSW